MFLSAVLYAVTGHAAMYTFVDERGGVHFSNVPDDRRYVRVDRLRAKLLRAKSGRVIDPREYEPYIALVAERYQIDPLLIKAVIKAESNFDYLAISEKGAQGLMQLMPGTAKDMNVKDPFDPKQNIRGGTTYLRKMLDTFNNDLELALAAYNAGPEQVKRNGRIPKFPETINYVNRVLRNYRRYRAYAVFKKGG
ncbi:MAG: transglycosylase SLT domain-containing protein [Desulfobulbaceae bacterium]|nr:transglycosylase SLT domain-containing protein [Desulfobulbaceae bacterium]